MIAVELVVKQPYSLTIVLIVGRELWGAIGCLSLHLKLALLSCEVFY